MRKRVLLQFVFLAACGLAFAACAARSAPAVEPEPSPQLQLVPAATPSAVPATATPVETRATPTPELFLEIIPSPQPSPPFSLGVPAGDLYAPSAIGVHAGSGRAYVLGARLPGNTAAVSTVDLKTGEVLRVTSLPAAGSASNGRVLVSPDGNRVYVVDRGAATLTLLDPETGELGLSIDGVVDAALSEDGGTLYAAGQGVRAFAAADLERGRADPLWETAGEGFQRVAVNGDVVAATLDAGQPGLVTLDAATGGPLGSVSLPEAAAGLAAAPDGGWAVRSGYSARLLRFDSGLRQIAEAEVPSGVGLFYDAPRRRYLVAGWSTGAGEGQVIQALDAVDLKPLQTHPWPSSTGAAAEGDVPTVFAPYGDSEIAGVSRSGRSRLAVLDAATLAPSARTILGVRLTGMALDEAAQLLYVADDHDRVRVLSLPDGAIIHTWTGAAPIALDALNRRLYVNRPGGVAGLDARSGAELARYPRNGMPAPDPHRDLVYITDEGVSIYDRAGAQIGRLDDTFPSEAGIYPNPFAFAARVDPVDGTLVTVFNNGTPGSNNRSFLRLYPVAGRQDGEVGRPITVTGPFTFVSDLAFDPKGDLLVSYSNAFNLEALQQLDSAGHELGRLGGRTGALALDPEAGLLYVASPGALARVSVLPSTPGPGDAGTMQLVDLYRGPSDVDQIALHADLRQLYVRQPDSSRVTVLSLDDLEPPDMRPVAVSGLPPDTDVSSLGMMEAGGETILYATAGWEHFRARVEPGSDGADLHWERLPVGSMPSTGALTVAGDTLFRAGAGEYGGDGVFRSRDGGDSWELLAAGLTDLRPAQPVLARNTDEAYFVGRTGGIFAWRGGSGGAPGKWERILPAEQDYASPGELSLAPDGTLFLASWDRVRRSTDGGRSWGDLPVPGEGVKIVGFGPDYARTQTVFSLVCTSDGCQVLRSRDGGETQQPVLDLPPYSYPLALLVPDLSWGLVPDLSRGLAPDLDREAAGSGQPVLYLYQSDYSAPQLHRSLDGGDSWQATDPDALSGVTAMALAPDGQLWIGSKGAVRVLDPAALSWSAVSPAPQPRAEPPVEVSSAATLNPGAPAPTPCPQGLPGLGCPVSKEMPASMASQPFEHGRMIWIGPDAGLSELQSEVLVLDQEGAGVQQGAWQRYPDTWQEGQPESDPAITPPAGLYQPIRGFGKVWREQLGGPQAASGNPATGIGWAIAPEQGLDGLVQRYEHGWVVRLDGERLLLIDDGSWRTAQ